MNQGIEGLGQKVSLSARVVTLITCMLSMNEAATRGVLLKKVFLKIAQNSGTGIFPVNFAQFLRILFIQNTSGRLLLP